MALNPVAIKLIVWYLANIRTQLKPESNEAAEFVFLTESGRQVDTSTTLNWAQPPWNRFRASLPEDERPKSTRFRFSAQRKAVVTRHNFEPNEGEPTDEVYSHSLAHGVSTAKKSYVKNIGPIMKANTVMYEFELMEWRLSGRQGPPPKYSPTTLMPVSSAAQIDVAADSSPSTTVVRKRRAKTPTDGAKKTKAS